MYLCNAFCGVNCLNMFDFETTVAGIEYKVRQLIEANERLQAKVMELTEETGKLQREIETQNISINHLKEENKVLKLGNALTQKGDTAEIKLKINRLIRNIDQSLALLTKKE